MNSSANISPELDLAIKRAESWSKKYFDLKRQKTGEASTISNLQNELQKKENRIKELESQNTKLKSQINGKPIVMPLEKAS